MLEVHAFYFLFILKSLLKLLYYESNNPTFETLPMGSEPKDQKAPQEFLDC